MTADIDPDEEWLNVEASAEKATPQAVRDILNSVEHSLRGAPDDGRRYDIELTITEHTAGEDE